MSTNLTKTVYPGKIYDHLLDYKQCAYYRHLLDRLAYEDGDPHQRYFQNIIKMPKVSNELWEIIKNDLPQKVKRHGRYYELIGLSDHITVSRHKGQHIGIHQDKDVRISQEGRHQPDLYCFYKLAIYLNDLSDPQDPSDHTGGTRFFNRYDHLLFTAKPQEGRGVLFDMREWHSGGHVPSGKTKYMLGARPIYRKVSRSEEHKYREPKYRKRCQCQCHRHY